MITWFKRLRLRSRRTSFSNNLEYLGEDLLRRVTRAARKETWGRSVMQLAWTAGPVTYLALQGGYMLGYGTNAPSNLFIYFAMYTVIAGVFAVLMRFLYQVTRGQELERSETAFREAMVRLPDLILYARNQTLLEYDEENRTLLAAKYLLENPDSRTETVKTAVEDITGDSELAQAAHRIEIYRKNGLLARIEDERSRVAERLNQTIEEVRLSSQTVADLLLRRFEGHPPSKQTGRTRTEGFIGRVLAAGEEHDFDSMTLNDAEEVYTLAYELLAGRNIPLFSLHYIGSKEFTEASENFDRARLAFRKAAYMHNSRLREMAELLAESERVDIVPAAAPVFTNVERMYNNILLAIEQHYLELKKLTGPMTFHRRKKQKQGELKKQFEQLNTALQLHRSLRTANGNLLKRYASLRRSEKRYHETRANSARKFPLHLLRPREHRRGIRIVEKHIALSKNSKMRFARDIQKFFNTIDRGNSPRAEDYKKLALDIAMKLEKELKMSRFEVQYAIESSNAPYLTSVEPDMTSSTKAGLAVALVREVQKNMHTPIHRLAHVLVNYHGMPLDQESIDYLVHRYGANPDRLAQLLPDQESEGDQESETKEAPPTEKRPSADKTRKANIPIVHKLDRKYQDLIDRAVKMNVL